MEAGAPAGEGAARTAFNQQSTSFDRLYSSNPIIRYKRKRVRDLVLQHMQPGQRILELNAGTGEDAVFFARQGLYVHATDVSEGMQAVLENKVRQARLEPWVSRELCSFTQLTGLKDKGPYDLIFSNFAGLNCTNALDQVLSAFPVLLKPGGYVVLTLMPGFCLWEVLLALRGDFKTAFRRFFSHKGASAQIEGVCFKCWYHPPGFISNTLGAAFTTLQLEGLCTLVPPSFLEHFPARFPRAYNHLVALENRWKGRWPWKYIGDYYIIALQKKPITAAAVMNDTC
jgi:ubiquinone/menaquinone biosynthesis C-methylase UbiE